MDQRADELPVSPHVVPQPRAVVASERAAVREDELLSIGQPVDEVERGVSERVSDCVAERSAVTELDQQVGDTDAGEPAAEDAREERHRHEREGDEEDVIERFCRVLGERSHDQLDEQDAHDERAGTEDRAERSTESAVGAEEAGDDDREHADDERKREHADDSGGDRVCGVAAGDGDRALAVGAVRVGLPVDQELRGAADEDERVGTDHEPEIPAAEEAPRRVREQQLHERAQREAVHEHPDGEDPIVVGLRQPPEAPEVGDKDEEDAGPVVRSAP